MAILLHFHLVCSTCLTVFQCIRNTTAINLLSLHTVLLKPSYCEHMGGSYSEERNGAQGRTKLTVVQSYPLWSYAWLESVRIAGRQSVTYFSQSLYMNSMNILLSA